MAPHTLPKARGGFFTSGHTASGHGGHRGDEDTLLLSATGGEAALRDVPG